MVTVSYGLPEGVRRVSAEWYLLGDSVPSQFFSSLFPERSFRSIFQLAFGVIHATSLFLKLDWHMALCLEQHNDRWFSDTTSATLMEVCIYWAV